MKRHIILAAFIYIMIVHHADVEKIFVSFVHNLQSGTLMTQSDTEWNKVE